MKKRMSTKEMERKDKSMDTKQGVKENSKKDAMLDKKMMKGAKPLVTIKIVTKPKRK